MKWCRFVPKQCDFLNSLTSNWEDGVSKIVFGQPFHSSRTKSHSSSYQHNNSLLQVCGSRSSECRADCQVWGGNEGNVDAEVGGGEHEVEPCQVEQRPGWGRARTAAGWAGRMVLVVGWGLTVRLAMNSEKVKGMRGKVLGRRKGVGRPFDRFVVHPRVSDWRRRKKFVQTAV